MPLPDRLSHLKHLCARPPKKPSEFIYVIGCNEFIKVGIASDINTRLRELQTGNPYPLRLYGHWRAGDAASEEKAIHVLLAPYRQRGEWFKLPKDMLSRITMKLPGNELAAQFRP